MLEKEDLKPFDGLFCCVKTPDSKGCKTAFCHYGYVNLKNNFLLLKRLDGTQIVIRYEHILSCEDSKPRGKNW